MAAKADVIVTRNLRHYKNSPIRAALPGDERMGLLARIFFRWRTAQLNSYESGAILCGLRLSK